MKARSRELIQLNSFVGKWSTAGRISASESAPEIIVSGTDTYEWLPGEFFLLHKADVLTGDEKNETFEIIGFDVQKGVFTMNYYDNKGDLGTMIAECISGTWVFLGEHLRFTGRFRNNGNEFSGIWEQSADGEHWIHLMDIILTRTD